MTFRGFKAFSEIPNIIRTNATLDAIKLFMPNGEKILDILEPIIKKLTDPEKATNPKNYELWRDFVSVKEAKPDFSALFTAITEPEGGEGPAGNQPPTAPSNDRQWWKDWGNGKIPKTPENLKKAMAYEAKLE